MSYTFTIAAPVTDIPAELFAAAGLADVACREGIDLTAAWPDGVTHFYRPAVSCRAIEVMSAADEFEVRIMAHSSPEDFALALGLIEAAARNAGVAIESEDGDTVTADEFRSRFDEAWVGDLVRSPFGMFNMIRNQGGSMTVHGAIRPMELGPAMLDELGFGQDDDFSTRFFEAFRRLQWLDLNAYFEATVMAITPQGSTDQKTLCSIGAPDLAYLLNRVDLIGAQTTDGELIFVPWESFGDAFGDQFHRLHENLVTIDPIPVADWPDVAQQMQSVSIALA